MVIGFILQCLTDDHEDIRSTVVFYITERLLKRFPKILCQHFIECIFHYNCYEVNIIYNFDDPEWSITTLLIILIMIDFEVEFGLWI